MCSSWERVIPSSPLQLLPSATQRKNTSAVHSRATNLNVHPPPRFGESFFSFLPRCVVGSFISAWRLEADRLRDRNLPFWQNEMLW